jgi:hypothetical protein
MHLASTVTPPMSNGNLTQISYSVCLTSHSHDATETQVFQLLKVPFWFVRASTWWVDLATLEHMKKGELSASRQAQIITDGICTVACEYTDLVLLNVSV